jgi:iron complex outermembrane receptor protein
MRNRTVWSSLLASASLLAIAGAAHAQQAAGTGAEAAAGAAEENALDEVVVTGSRIARAGYTAPTPVTVMNTDELNKKAPSNLPDALNQLPQFAGSISQNAQADTGASKVRSGNYLDIRALGSQRVLILEDGRRVPPTSSNGSTDANLIPQMLIDRVDIVTGGASAAYGSDAVSGVVNFILDKGFTGVKLVAQTGVATEGDDASYKAGVAAGKVVMDGKLHLLGSAEYYHSDGVTNRASRHASSGENTESAVTTGGFGTAAQPFFYVSNAHNNASAYGGYILGGPLVGKQFNPDGSVAAFNPGPAIPGRPGYGIGGDGIVNPSRGRTGIPTLTTTQVFGRATYDLTPDVSAFAQVSYNTGRNKDRNATPGTPGAGAPIFRENAYLRPDVLAQLGAAASFNIARPFAEWSLNDQEQRSRSVIATVGLDATIRGAKTHVYYIHGDTKFTTEAYGIDNRKFFAAIDAVRNAAGNIVCRITITNPGLQDGCVPLNIIGVGNGSTAAEAYVRDYSIWEATNKLDLVAGDVSGELFSLPAGPVSVAVGAEYRHQSLVQTSNSDPALPVDFTGLRGVNTTSRFAGVNVGVADGAYSVAEVYGELAVPVLKDSAIGDLDLNGAARYTHYSTSGAVTTWKVGASYKPIPDLRLRGTVSRDIRAPSLFELFAGKQQTTSPLTDLHTGLSRSTNVISSGNPDLKPEVADTYTVGAVFSPRAWPGFNASVDYYRIKIDDAIAQPFTYIQMDDLCEASNGTSELCQQIIRPGPFSDRSAANYPTEIRLQNLNLASVKTSGVDFEASWRGEMLDGMVGVRVLGTRLIDYIQQNSAQSVARQYAGNADFIQGFYPLPMPKWRGNLELNYSRDSLSFGLQERYVGDVHKSDQFLHQVNRLKGVFYTDLNATYSRDVMGAKTDFYITVNNVFDQKGRLFLISPVPGLNIPTARSVYDIVGRYFTVGVKARF